MEQDLPDATPLMDADDIERALLGFAGLVLAVRSVAMVFGRRT